MVKGLSVFRKNFENYTENFVVIGGTACFLSMAKAFLDLSERREKGENIDSRDISKHRNDIFRLTMIADPEFKTDIPEKISDDMKVFIEKMKTETVDLKSIGIKGISKESIMERLMQVVALPR
jgi:hypothetical protein